MEVISSGVTDLIMGIITEGFIIVAICFAVGQIIKTSKIKILKKIPNENIPIITTILGIILSLIPGIFPGDGILIGIIKGAVSGWAATGCFELFRQYKKKKETSCEE